jgi:hypothetical protein
MEQTHFKDCAHDLRAPSNTIVTPTDDLTCKIYNLDRQQQAVDSFDQLKAAGPDTIRPIIVQKVRQHIKAITRSIMIHNHELQYIPNTWKESLGIFHPKPGKTDNNHPKSYKTITLCPVMLKLQEKAILWHMQHDLNIATDLNKRQFGFRKRCSTKALRQPCTK